MDEKEFDKELADVPEGVLPEVIELLKKLISEDTNKAFDYIYTDPLASVAIPTILRDLKDTEDPMFMSFKEKYFKHISNLFSLEQMVNDVGLAYTVELMLGKWRQLTQSLEFDSTIDYLLSNLVRMREEVNLLEPTPSNRVIFEMVDDSLRRIESVQNYEMDKAKKTMLNLNSQINSVIQQQINSNDSLSEALIPWLNIASMKHQTAVQLRETVKSICLSILKENFPNLDEDEKFKLAPWLMFLEKSETGSSVEYPTEA